MLRAILLAAGCVGLLGMTGPAARAGLITPGAFGPGTVIVDYDAVPPGVFSTPFVIAGDTYATDSGILQVIDFGAIPAVTGMSETLIATATFDGFGFIDVVLATPVLRAGATFGSSSPWTASVSFFDESDSLLGTVEIGGAGGVGAFAGWEADSGLISRIRAADNTQTSALGMDNLMLEQASAVPEPASLTLVGLAALGMGLRGLGAICRHRRLTRGSPGCDQ